MLRVEGHVVHHDREFEAAIEIDTTTGLIASVTAPTGHSDLDTTGCLIFPGFGDIHIHARDDASKSQTYKEDFATASAAAIHGGVTHVADMPNNPIAPSNDARYTEKQRLTEVSEVHVTLYAAIAPGTQPLMHHVPYKAYMGHSVGNMGFESREELEEVIALYRGRNVSFHCEDPEVLRNSANAPTHEQRRPAVAEITATEFALYLIEKYDLIGKLCHYSTRDGLQKVIAAKQRGLTVTCEVTPHHLYFDETMLTPANHTWLQMNPPLRGPADRIAMIDALRSGQIDYIATDHAPHTIEENIKGISGVPLLDTYGAFTTWLMTKHNFTAQDIARVCAYNPSRFVREFLPPSLGKGFGLIEPGYTGSLTILDPHKPWTVQRSDIKSKCGWSPFEGHTFPGSVRYTVLSGKVHSNT